MKVISVVSGIALLSLTSFAGADKGKAILSDISTVHPIGGMVMKLSGTVMLEDTPSGLKIDAEITQAPPGQHAFHIHEFGLCDDQGKAAGSHYNPAGHPHGNALKDGIMKAHAGDFGSITVNDSGMGSLHVVVPGLALSSGQAPVAGRAFILHEKMDDFSQPAGNAGSRIGCGPIVLTGK
jgi:Cu-Zn family superoxide dismutase